MFGAHLLGSDMARRGQSYSRRDWLQISSALGLSFLLPPLEMKAAEKRGVERPKSLITVWLEGGPSQLETWDPHPGTKIGGQVKSIPTRNPELQICEFFPRVAEQIQHLSVIRSMISKEGDHERGAYLLKTGYRPDPTTIHPSLGAILAHELPDEKVEIPAHISLLPAERAARGGYFGDQYDAFKVHDAGRALQNMEQRVEKSRFDRRLSGLNVVDRAFKSGRRLQADATLHGDTVRRAVTMMQSEQLAAFKIEEESAERKAAYGDTQFGRACLVARRLVERGVRAIEVTLSSFDTHANNHKFHQQHATTVDPALAALIQDLADRDLLASTVVLCIGEFGRTPKINPLEGRDHWPTGFSALIGGGGLKGGQVIGATDPTGEKTQPTDPIEVPDLFATILKTCGVDYAREMTTPIGRPMKISDGKPVERLLPS